MRAHCPCQTCISVKRRNEQFENGVKTLKAYVSVPPTETLISGIIAAYKTVKCLRLPSLTLFYAFTCHIKVATTTCISSRTWITELARGKDIVDTRTTSGSNEIEYLVNHATTGSTRFAFDLYICPGRQGNGPHIERIAL